MKIEPEKFRAQYKVRKIFTVGEGGGEKVWSVGFPETTKNRPNARLALRCVARKNHVLRTLSWYRQTAAGLVYTLQ